MPTRWIHAGSIPPCPCGAPPDDQARRYGGGDRVDWFCLICESFRAPPADWSDELVPISEDDWRAQSRAMTARVRARWKAAASSPSLPSRSPDRPKHPK